MLSVLKNRFEQGCRTNRYPKEKVKACLQILEWSEHTRAEELTPEQFLRLFQELHVG